MSGGVTKRNKMKIPFDVFKQFLELNYPFCPDTEKAKLYRDAWCLGEGVVNYESFFIAASESNFFTLVLKHQYFANVSYL
mmetsp:Transcript_23049/g.20009  ORF Transcript_23049/g.20009 Transcript_23049/m.20009 type:complete len:80 (+) Transcript_23049:116-355(+)